MDIVLTGSVAFDYLMKFPGYFRDHILPERLELISLSFLVESMVVQRGGIAPNIAYTLALLGNHPRVMATVGQDFESYGAWLESKGVDISLIQVIPGVFTASFFANTDKSNAQIASFYPGAMAYAAQLSFRGMPGKPDLVVISPNDPAAMNAYVVECRELGIPYIYDPSQQIVRLDAGEVRRGIEGARALFVNEYEFALIQKMTGLQEGGNIENLPVPGGDLRRKWSQYLCRAGKISHPHRPTPADRRPDRGGRRLPGRFLDRLRTQPELGNLRADGRLSRHLLPGTNRPTRPTVYAGGIRDPFPPEFR